VNKIVGKIYRKLSIDQDICIGKWYFPQTKSHLNHQAASIISDFPILPAAPAIRVPVHHGIVLMRPVDFADPMLFRNR